VDDVRWASVRSGLGALLAGVLAAVVSVGGCDWFNNPEEANLAPDTSMVLCPSLRQDVLAGDDVTLEWTGDDIDGDVVEYEWTYDDTSGTTSQTALTFEHVTEGEHLFEVAAVDNDGAVDETPAVCEFTAQLVDRVVLVEFLTTLVCTNCPNAEEALDRVLDYYGPDRLTIVSYHDDVVPGPGGPDPVDTAETIDRIHWYTADTGHAGEYPAVIVDGGIDRIIVGATSPEAAEAEYTIEIDYRRAFPSPVTVGLSGEIDGGRGEVTVRVRVHDALPAGDYVLRSVVIEDDISVGEHDFGFVARDLLDDEPLTVSAVGDSAVVERSFTVDPSWVVGNMDVIAFVQNDDTKAVLQSGRLNAR
jgi:hypothetical protein